MFIGCVVREIEVFPFLSCVSMTGIGTAGVSTPEAAEVFHPINPVVQKQVEVVSRHLSLKSAFYLSERSSRVSWKDFLDSGV